MYIYKTTNLINKKYYIGKDSRDKNSKKAQEYLGSGIILQRAINKYGKQYFKKEIIDECDTTYELNYLEQFWINYYHSTNKRIGYNIHTGGQGGDTLTNNPNIAKIGKKISIKAKEMWATRNRNVSQETKNKMSVTRKEKKYKPNKGRVFTEEWKKNIGKASEGRISWLKGNHQSEETKQKISKSLKGRIPWNKGLKNKKVSI